MNMQMDRRVTEEWEKSLRETVAERHLFLWEMALFVWQVETSDMQEIKIFERFEGDEKYPDT